MTLPSQMDCWLRGWKGRVICVAVMVRNRAITFSASTDLARKRPSGCKELISIWRRQRIAVLLWAEVDVDVLALINMTTNAVVKLSHGP